MEAVWIRDIFNIGLDPAGQSDALPSQREPRFLVGQEAKADKKKNRPLGQTVASSVHAPQAACWNGAQTSPYDKSYNYHSLVFK